MSAELQLLRVGVFSCVLGPRVQGRDVTQLLFELLVVKVIGVEETTDVPKLPKRTAALVRRKFSPDLLARHFDVQADHVRLNETLIRLEQRDAVHFDQVDVW